MLKQTYPAPTRLTGQSKPAQDHYIRVYEYKHVFPPRGRFSCPATRAGATFHGQSSVEMHQFFWPGTCESWFGVCPGNVELAGKRKPRHTTQGNVWLQRVLDEVAWAAGRFKETVFATQFRCLAGHRKKEPSWAAAQTWHEKRELAFQTFYSTNCAVFGHKKRKTISGHKLRAPTFRSMPRQDSSKSLKNINVFSSA